MLFIDSADVAEIQAALETGVISGVTTNPSIMANARARDMKTQFHAIRKVFPAGHISVEVTHIDTYEEALADALALLDGGDERMFTVEPPTIKVPMHPEWGLKLIRELSSRHITINATCLMTRKQCLLAEAAGASYVSLFYNRMIDGNKAWNPQGKYARFLAQDTITDTASQLKTAKLICGSIRAAGDVWECLCKGADIVTVPYKFLGEVLEGRLHPKTEEAIKEFDEKWKKVAASA